MRSRFRFPPFRPPFRFPIACVLAASLLFPGLAGARNSRDLQLLQQRMQAAQAVLADGNRGDAERQAAIKQMASVLVDCGKVRGCEMQPFLDAYSRALADSADEDDDTPTADDERDDDDDLVDVATDTVPGSATADALLDERNRRFMQMVQMNPAVQAGIRRWLTDLRPSLLQSYENYQYMRYLMAPSFQHHGLPEALLFGIVAKESNGKVHVGSRAGAVGPLQFMPDTGRRFGLGDDGTGFDTRYDARASAEAAAEYLQERFAQLNNSIEMALAAYNGGEGRALRAYQGSGGRSFWDGAVYDQFPAETRDYVPMVIAAAWLYLHPSQYGLRFPRISNRPAVLRLQRPTTIYELTICLGNRRGTNGYLRALRNLNPRYEPDTPLPAGSTLNVTSYMGRLYGRYCVNGQRAQLAQQLMASNPAQAIVRVGDMTTVPATLGSDGAPHSAVPTTVATGRPAPVARRNAPARATTHRVARGDTVVGIAQKYQCDTKTLARANGLKAPRYLVRPGQVLKLSGCQR